MRYTVKPGDTLSGIAQQFGTSWQELQQLNPSIIDPGLIYPGQELEVPDGSAAQPEPAQPPPTPSTAQPEPVQPPAPPDEGITLDQLRGVMPNVDDSIDEGDLAGTVTVEECLSLLNTAMAEFSIDTRLRVAAFLGNVAVESGELRYMEEIWGPTPQQEGYEGREDLGNTEPGDGYRYRGRGPIQLTGRANYRAVGEALGLELEDNPDQVATAQVGFRVACHFWRYRSAWGDLNDYADQGDFDHTVLGVNGGWYGYDDRLRFYKQALEVLPENLSIGGGLTP